MLSVKQFERLFDIIQTYFDVSAITDFLIDCHPNHLDTEKIDVFLEAGVTRLTLAIQSLDEEVLSLNNRDSYDLNHIRTLAKYLSNTPIKVNIDLLIGLR